MVEVQPDWESAERGEEGDSTGLCIVVDAGSGKVIGRWPGTADRPDRGSDARGAEGGEPADLAARGGSTPHTLSIYNGTEGGNGGGYASFRVSGDARVSRWPEWYEGILAGVARTDPMDAVTANARNVARTICVVRGYCGRTGGFRDRTESYPGTVSPWELTGNVPGTSSSTLPLTLEVEISQDDVMQGNGNPNLPFNDVIAHEFGHVMDLVYAGDRFVGGATFMGREVMEALADMFAYDYDRGDATFAEESGSGTARNWADPGAVRTFDPDRGLVTYPAQISDYDNTPSSPHFNSTILSHAYYLFVQRVGHSRAGRVLHNVPSYLSPRPTFREVAQGFVTRSVQVYPQDGSDSGSDSDVAQAAQASFAEVGLSTTMPRDHRGER